MANRPTLQDVASAAGVSVATVDRVINNRVKVQENTARKVSEAAHRIGYHATTLIDHRIRSDLPERCFGFLLHKERQHFYRNLAAEIKDELSAQRAIRGKSLVEFSSSQSPADVAAHLRSMLGRADAVAATAFNHPLVTEAVRDLKRAGLPVFALLSDFAQAERSSYVGLDNLKVGRIAAWMLATAARSPGPIALFLGGHRWHGHECRETGFRNYFREYSPDFTVLDTQFNMETRQLTYEATLQLLDRHHDLAGIYIAGGGMEGAIEACRELRQPGHVGLVVNELTPESRVGLSERYVTMVNATPVPQLCSDLVKLMCTAVSGEKTETTGQHFLEPRIYLPESF